LRGYDELVNLVLDDCDEFLRGEWLLLCVCSQYWCEYCVVFRPYLSLDLIIMNFHDTLYTSNYLVCTQWCHGIISLGVGLGLGIGYLDLDSEDPEQVTDKTRRLGLVVIRGTQVSLLSPEDGLEEIANPFLGGAEEEEAEG
jgi:small nuclear ribonucleoprotein (snRNP)-like protein